MGAMSKRTDTIKSLFTASQGALSADNNAPVPLVRVSSGAVRSLKDSFSDVEKENQELRDKLAAGAPIIEIDPTLIDPSPVSDRLRDDDPTSYEALKQSIAECGQEIPILVREHPTAPGRYQNAYGHRRVRAAGDLGIPVKAVVKSLSDEALVVAQGLENAPREDLSFIERARFAMHIEDAGHKRSIVQNALAVDRAEASKLVAVARAIPGNIIEAIGKAPKIGRGRWQALADMLNDAAALKRVSDAVTVSTFAAGDSNAKFLIVFTAARRLSGKDTSNEAGANSILTAGGQRFAQVKRTSRKLTLSIDKNVPEAFADFLVEQLPHLFNVFAQSNERKEVSEA